MTIHDPNQPITPQVLMEHVSGLRAEMESLRQISDIQREATKELLAAGAEFRKAAINLTNELMEIKQWRSSVESRLDTIPPEENGAYGGL
jgi:predicted  nucleic acid-binding Zn-ribbon protein